MAHRTRAAAPADRDVPRLDSALDADTLVSVLVADLERAHRFFNYRFFGGVLPAQTALTLEHSPSRCRFGVFHPEGWPQRIDQCDHIAITSLALREGPVQILSTLLHEMAHQWNRTAGIVDGGRGNYHNQHFRDTALLAGLRCTNGARGYAHTEPAPRALRAIDALLGRTLQPPPAQASGSTTGL